MVAVLPVHLCGITRSGPGEHGKREKEKYGVEVELQLHITGARARGKNGLEQLLCDTSGSLATFD